MWNRVSLGFDGEEETVNFGSRQVAVCESAVYETNTLAVVTKNTEDDRVDSQTDEVPWIRCVKYAGSDSGIIVIVNESLIMFNNEGNELKNKCSFDASVDCQAITADCSILFVALNNGNVHCSLLKTGENFMFLKNICNSNTRGQNTFVNMLIRPHEDKIDLIFISHSGNIYVLKELNLTELKSACATRMKEQVSSVVDDTKSDYISLNQTDCDCYNIIFAVEFPRFDEQCLLTLIQSKDRQELLVWSENFRIFSRLPLLKQYHLKKVQILRNGSLIYGLTTQGSVLVMCPYTLTLLRLQENISLIDFEIMNEEDSSILALTNTTPPMLQLITLPGFNVKFRMNVTDACMSYLAEGQSSLDDLNYLELLYTKPEVDSSRKVLQGIHLKMISESQPEYRLDRILRRGKFQEAENFARNFKLNLETVYEAHLQKLLNDIQPWTTGAVSVEESGNLFKNLLRKVKDVKFVARCALNAVSSDFELIKDILNYAETLIKPQISSDSQADTELQGLYNRVRDLLLRLNTFCMISNKPLMVDKWLAFHKANLIEECQSLLKEGKLNEMILIWARHLHELKGQLTFELASYFLRSVPSSISLSQTLEWLQIFLPTFLSLFPKIISPLVGWCKAKVNTMELLAEPNWIETSINFLKKILTMVRANVKPCQNSSSSLIQSEYAADSPIEDMLFYIRILTEMSIMKKTYGINISIIEYSQTSSQEVILTILDKVPLEELNAFVTGFMEQLLLRKNLNADSVISEYIQSLVEGSVNWWYWEEAPWEGRVAILLECIAGIQEKLNSVLNVLKYSPVPWSSTISSICEEALKYENAQTKLIREQKRMVSCKLVLKKYDLKDINVIKPHFDRIVQFIFLQGRSTMLDDALQIANTFDAEMCTEVYIQYVQLLIENGEGAKAMSFLDDDSLPLKVVIHCYNSIILKAHSLSSLPSLSSRYDRYVINLDEVSGKLDRATVRLKATGETIFSAASPDMCKQLTNIHYVKRNFKEDVAVRHFTYPEERENLLTFCLNEGLQRMGDDCKAFENERLKLTKLANCFECSKYEVYVRLINLAVHESQVDVAIYLSRFLLKEDSLPATVSKQVIDMADSVLAYCIKNPRCVSENNLAAYIHQLIVVSLDSCPPDALSKGLEIGKWFRLMQSYVQLDDSVMTSSGAELSCSNNVNSSAVLKLLGAYSSYSQVNNLESSAKYLSVSDLDETQPSDDVAPDLSQMLQNIVDQENETISFQIVTILHWLMLHYNSVSQQGLSDCKLIELTKSLFQLGTTKLLKKLIGSRHLDIQFGTALLHHFSKEDASKWIFESTKRFKFDFQRLSAITELGMVYFNQNQCENEWNEIYSLRKQCNWGKQIMEYGLSYKEAFRESPSERKQLLLKLMAIPSIKLNVLAKYCRDMNFDFQACLKAYLRQTLLAWEPEYEVKVNPQTGDKELIVKATRKILIDKCREIISLIENTSQLSDLISTVIWDSINYYYYEVFLVLLTLMTENAAKTPLAGLFSAYRNVFIFLLSYQRVSKPQEYEREQWFLIYPNAQSLPPISEYRLPFRLIWSHWTKSHSDPWKIIQPELNIRTYSRWFAVLDLLKLDRNVLCTAAIMQMADDKNPSEGSKTEWCIHLRHQKLLADVQKCIDQITSLEMASASFYYVVNHLPPGADQLAAAKLCFLHAKQWHEKEKSEMAEAGFLKCQKKYLTISTTHILYTHHLGNPQYVNLVLNPVELIRALYDDPIILQMKSGNVLVLPDINKATEEISTLHKVDVSHVRLELLEEWLSPENFMVDVSISETICRLESNNDVEKFSAADHENFLRTCYVVERDVRSFGPYLAGIVFDRYPDDSKPISVRLRALQCLYAVTSEHVLEQITGKTIDALRDYMNTLEFVTELEMLGLTYSLTAFNSCNKVEVARSLLMLKNAKAVRLAARLSQYFGVQTPAVWNSILTKMCSYEMIKELIEVLPSLSDNYHTIDLSVSEKAWNTVLLTPLKKAHVTLSEDQRDLIEESLKLIYFCPIIDKLDVETLKKNCNRIELKNWVERICNLQF